jgi:acetyl esterase/lipase
MRKIIMPVVTGVVLIMTCACLNSRSVEREISIKKNIQYLLKENSSSQFLDVYSPSTVNNAPVLFFIHGGGWKSGSKDRGAFERFATSFAKNGYVVVMPNYRLAPEVKYPAQIEDVASAFAWTYKNIKDYGGNPDKIFISGNSAGGHLVALLGTDQEYLGRLNIPNNAIKGVLALSGIYDISKLKNFPRKELVEPAFGIAPEVWEKASPIKYVRSGLPPFFILYSSRDPSILQAQAKAFAEKLKEKNDKVTLFELKHEGHVSEILGGWLRENPMQKPMLEFLNSL